MMTYHSTRRTFLIVLMILTIELIREAAIDWANVSRSLQLRLEELQMIGPRDGQEDPIHGPGNVTEVEDLHLELPHVDKEAQPEHLKNLTWFDCKKYSCEKTKGLENLHLREGPVLPSSRNVTPSGASLVVYNRVNKCGSITTRQVVMRLQKKLKFRYISDKNFGQRLLRRDDQKELVKSLNKTSPSNATVFERFTYYFNMTRYGMEQPILFNMIRDPVARYISHFYYIRDPVKWSLTSTLRDLPKPPKSWFEKDLNTCLLEGDPECVLLPGKMREMMLTYFCGQHPACMEIGNVGALQRAKRHVEDYYSVVGILEEIELSFKVLEAYVPRFFKGAAKTYKKKNSEVHSNQGRIKPNVTNNTMRRLIYVLALDIEFYEFVKQRLHLQAEAVNIV